MDNRPALKIVPPLTAAEKLVRLEAERRAMERELVESWIVAINETLALGSHVKGLSSLPGVREIANRVEQVLAGAALGVRGILERE